MAITQERSSKEHPPESRWNRALSGEAEAFQELAAGYWYGVYAWWRRSGLEAGPAAASTIAAWTQWGTAMPPRRHDPGAARLREWLSARLSALPAAGVELSAPPALTIDPEWAERRYAEEPAGEPGNILQRRWALTVLEFALATLRAEYEARGEQTLFAELLAYAGFGQGAEEAYAESAARTGASVSAMRKAVYDFRTRQRDLLHAFAADTLADAADLESEMTALLVACDAAGAAAATAPLPSTLASVQPDQVLARALQSVKMSTVGGLGWTPPTVAELARLFPGYEILSMLGHGGMGAVYQARQTALDRLVAIKLLPLEISVDRDFSERFRREARAMAKLNHPHIISVFDFGQTGEGHLFFVMEFVEGAMLHDLIHGGAAPAPAEVLALVEQVCDALAYAHEQGIVHRDIKPANVMVDRRGRVKVADFGLARVVETASAEAWGSTMTGIVMGTPDYMAPEQKRGMHVDQRADIYSLGVLLYEGLCKETPQGAFQLPSKHCGLDKRLDAIITRALASRPEDRFQTTAEMKAAIEQIRPAVAKAQAKKAPARPMAAPPALTVPVVSSNPAPPVKRRAKWYVGSALAAVLVAGAAMLSLRGTPRKPEPSVGSGGPAPLPPAPLVWRKAPLPEAESLRQARGSLSPEGELHVRNSIALPGLRARNLALRGELRRPVDDSDASITLRDANAVSRRFAFYNHDAYLQLSRDHRYLSISYQHLPDSAQTGGKWVPFFFATVNDSSVATLNSVALPPGHSTEALVAGIVELSAYAGGVDFRGLEYVILDDVPEARWPDFVRAALKLELVISAAGSSPPDEPWQDALKAPSGLQVSGNAKIEAASAGMRLTGPGGVVFQSGPRQDGAVRMIAACDMANVPPMYVRARGQADGSVYQAYLQGGNHAFMSCWDGPAKHTRPLADFTLLSPVAPENDYELELRVVGSQLVLKLDGKVLGSATDTALREGLFGLGTQNNAPTLLKAVQYLDLSPPKP